MTSARTEAPSPRPRGQLPTQYQHDRPLAECIAIATRSIHAKLNKLIIARLPLALPPNAADPSIYISGLLHITPIYTTFETLWCDILSSISTTKPGEDSSGCCKPNVPPWTSDPIVTSSPSKAYKPPICGRLNSLLQHLYSPELMRSDRLKADIANLAGWPDDAVNEQLEAIGKSGRLGEFTAHIKRAVDKKPHVLLAYSYILFMALFAGGRFIRATLECAGEDFWKELPSPVKPTKFPCQPNTRPTKRASGLTDDELPAEDHHRHSTHTMPLRFFHFQTPEDGEDLKREFKQRLAQTENILTTEEKQDIIQESVCIFENMSLLVHQLDSICDGPIRQSSGQTASIFDIVGHFHPFRSRLRDSLSVAKERSQRSSRNSTSVEDSAQSIVKQAWRLWRSKSDASIVKSSPSPNTPDIHPVVSNEGSIELCPAFSKSMRFDNTLPRPARSVSSLVAADYDLRERLDMASRRLWNLETLVWFLISLAILGAFYFVRTGGQS